MYSLPTYSGVLFDLQKPLVDQVRIEDVAHHLSLINRFNGSTRKAYSVAQHSVIVCRLITAWRPEYALYGLLHDAEEAYTGDMTRPWQNTMGPGIWKNAQWKIRCAVLERFGLGGVNGMPFADSQAFHEIDRAVCEAEGRLHHPGWTVGREGEAAVLLDSEQCCWPADVAEDVFLGKFRELTGGSAAE